MSSNRTLRQTLVFVGAYPAYRESEKPSSLLGELARTASHLDPDDLSALVWIAQSLQDSHAGDEQRELLYQQASALYSAETCPVH